MFCSILFRGCRIEIEIYSKKHVLYFVVLSFYGIISLHLLINTKQLQAILYKYYILLKVENCLECVKHYVLVIQKLYHLDKQYSIVNVVLEFEKWTTLATMSSTPVTILPALRLIITPPFPNDSYHSRFKKMNNSHYNVTFIVFYFMQQT